MYSIESSGKFFVDMIIKGGIKKFCSNLTLESCDQFYPLKALLNIDDQSVFLINSPRSISIFELQMIKLSRLANC